MVNGFSWDWRQIVGLMSRENRVKCSRTSGGTESNPFNFTFYFFRIVDLSKDHKGCQFWMAFMFECALMNSLPVSKSSLTQRKNSSENNFKSIFKTSTCVRTSSAYFLTRPPLVRRRIAIRFQKEVWKSLELTQNKESIRFRKKQR